MRKFASISARSLFLWSSLAALASPRLAHAQAVRADRVQNEVFEDDLLNADLGTPFGAHVFPPHLPPARTLLIRPRTNFIPELYKSIEHL